MTAPIKRSLDDLAIFGGSPAFDQPLHVGRPNIGDRKKLLERIDDILDRRWLTNNGRYVQEFERQIADFVGAKHCIATCNATVAIAIAARAVGLAGEVIVPAFTFVALPHALEWLGITPVFCDIRPESHQLDPGRIEELITDRTSAIFGVHLWGKPCDIDALVEIGLRRNLSVLFDAAHAFGCSYRDRMIGTFGDAEIFSFHATKILNSFEGGAVVTNNNALAHKVRVMKTFGFASYDHVTHLGVNGKMSEVSAAMGLTSLEGLPKFIAINQRNYDAYRKELADIPGLRLWEYDAAEKCNYHYVVIEVNERATHITRNQLADILWAENVLARRYFYPGCHRMEPYRSQLHHAGRQFPVTERVAERVLCLPTGATIGRSEIQEICRLIRFTVGQGIEVRERLRGAVAEASR